jgi:polyphosphate kinase
VISIVGRLLEHSRIYAFERHGEHTVYIASADLMPRNLDHRVELAAPIESSDLQAELLDTLHRGFADNQSSWELDGRGEWHRRSPEPGQEPRSLQLELAEIYAAKAASERPAADQELTAAPLRAGAVR